MKILIKRNCSAAGKHLSAGETYDLPDGIASRLVVMGRATALTEAEDVVADRPVSVRDPKVVSRDPEIAIGDVGSKAIASNKRGK